MSADGGDVVQRAERVLFQASWRIQEEATLDALAGTRGLCWAPLESRSDIIQLVTYDGEHLGHIRRDSNAHSGERWVAVRRLPGRAVGCYGTPHEAAEALALACGKRAPEPG
jgi:hypothetical protein